MEKEFYRISEVAQILGIGKSLAYQLVASGEIPSVRLAGRRSVRIHRKALEDWIAKQVSMAAQGLSFS